MTIENCLFGVENIMKNNDKEKYVHSRYGIAFDGKSEWSFGNDLAKNFIAFTVDNISSSHTDNLKNGFLILGEDPTFDINRRCGASEKNMILILVKQRQNFVWVCIIIVTIVIYL